MSQGKKKRIEVSDVGDVAMVEFLDKRILDEQNILLIGEQLFELVDDLGRKKILLNFGNVEYLSSAMLGKLFTLVKKVKGVSGQLKFCSISPDVREPFRLTSLDKMVKIFDNDEKALATFT